MRFRKMMKDIPKKTDEIEVRDLEEEIYVLSLKKGRIYRLNEMGSRIWALIDGKKTVDEIINSIFKTYDASKSAIKKDVLDFIKKGVDSEILEFKSR
ncbi:MAG: PqqD family protein [Candidatus Altiarchaeota archaeon]|nr:PqqD family protein [Candidatus Altiarchaeota archaeon]